MNFRIKDHWNNSNQYVIQNNLIADIGSDTVVVNYTFLLNIFRVIGLRWMKWVELKEINIWIILIHDNAGCFSQIYCVDLSMYIV
jgi:hypothetical protein